MSSPQRDGAPVVVMIYSCIGIVGMILGDLLMVVIDPRISLKRKESAR